MKYRITLLARGVHANKTPEEPVDRWVGDAEDVLAAEKEYRGDIKRGFLRLSVARIRQS